MIWIGTLAFGIIALASSGEASVGKIPLTIKAVQEGPSGLSPVPDTIFTLASTEGFILHEVQPHADGTTQIQVSPGKYILSALHGGKPLKVEVQPPETTITVLVSGSGETLRVLPQIAKDKIEDGKITPLLWIGLGFVAAIVIFLMITSFVRLNEQADKNLRFLTALCAGFAGGFFTGDALFHYERQLSNGTSLFLSGTAGFALFFLVWLTYGKKSQVAGPKPISAEDKVKLSIPEGWSFEQAARAIAKSAGRTVYFNGFDQEQLATVLPEIDLEAPTVRDALEQLQHAPDGILKYRVFLEKGVYHIQRS